MRLGLFLIVVFLLQCYGAPPEEDDTLAFTRAKYTDQEDDFIIEELVNLPADKQNMPDKALWEYLANKHNEKWTQRTIGFPQERTPKNLRLHFKMMVKSNARQIKKKVPENILQRVQLDLNKSPRVRTTKTLYTTEEEQFLIKELSKSSCTNVFGPSILETIRQKHADKRKAQSPGFENERTFGSLRTHICKMKDNNQLPDEVTKKIRIREKGASSSKMTPPNPVSKETKELDEEDEKRDEQLMNGPNLLSRSL